MSQQSQDSTSIRVATAQCKLKMAPEVAAMFTTHSTEVQDHIESARFTGMLSSKHTAQLLPFCKPVAVAPLLIEFSFGHDHVLVTSRAQTYELANVEMEALTGCAITAMTLYSSAHHLDEMMRIDNLALDNKIIDLDAETQPLSTSIDLNNRITPNPLEEAT